MQEGGGEGDVTMEDQSHPVGGGLGLPSLALKMEEPGPQVKDHGKSAEAEKGQETEIPLASPEGRQPN